MLRARASGSRGAVPRTSLWLPDREDVMLSQIKATEQGAVQAAGPATQVASCHRVPAAAATAQGQNTSQPRSPRCGNPGFKMSALGLFGCRE